MLALELDDTHARACLLLCQALMKTRNWEEALAAATKAIELGHREGHRERGAVYMGMSSAVRADARFRFGSGDAPDLSAARQSKDSEAVSGDRTRGAATETPDASSDAKTVHGGNGDASELATGSVGVDPLVLASSDLNVAVRLDAGDVNALRLRAEVRRLLGDAARAEEDERAVREIEKTTDAQKKPKDFAEGDPDDGFYDDRGILCVVCLDAPRDTRLSPCAHSALCGDCAKACKERQGACPICNREIKAIEWGSFAQTFAPAEAKLHFARLASAVKKAKEEDARGVGGDAESIFGGTSAGDASSSLASSGSSGSSGTLASSRRTMPTLTPASFVRARRSPRDDEEDGFDSFRLRPATPPRDFSEYTVGAGMEDDLETLATPTPSRPSRPSTFGSRETGVFGDVASFGVTGSPAPMGGTGNLGSSARGEAFSESPPERPETPRFE